jgi:uncharacterized protein (TIGR00369 family)
MSNILTADQIQEKLSSSPFISFMQIRVVSADAEKQEVVMVVPMRPEFERRAGTGQMHGGPIAAFIDTVGDYALGMLVGSGLPTVNFRVDYLRPAVNTALTGRALVRRAGKSIGVVDIDVTDDAGRLIAIGRGSYSMLAG